MSISTVKPGQTRKLVTDHLLQVGHLIGKVSLKPIVHCEKQSEETAMQRTFLTIFTLILLFSPLSCGEHSVTWGIFLGPVLTVCSRLYVVMFRVIFGKLINGNLTEGDHLAVMP